MPTRRQLERWNNRARASSLAELKRHAHFDQRDKEIRMAPKKPKFVGEAPVVNRLDGHPEEGEVVGTAKLEKLPGGNIVVHVDGNTITGEMLRRGFSFGSFSIKDDEVDDGPIQLEG